MPTSHHLITTLDLDQRHCYQHVLSLALLIALLFSALADFSGVSNTYQAIAPNTAMADARHARQPELAMAAIAVDRQSPQPSLPNGGERVSHVCETGKIISKNRENRGKHGSLLNFDKRDVLSVSLRNAVLVHFGYTPRARALTPDVDEHNGHTPVFSCTALTRTQLARSAPLFATCYPRSLDRQP